MSYIVGLTGGIGSGKTLISDHLGSLGTTVIDTDVIARKIVEPGQAALNALVSQFGEQILLGNGELNRAALREIAFSSPTNKKALDHITHPAIRAETNKQISDAITPYCLVVVPLLDKTSPFMALMQRVLVVTAQKETKIARVKQRSNLTPEEVERIMATQLDDQERLSFADDVIENNGSIEKAKEMAEQLHQRYINLSKT